MRVPAIPNHGSIGIGEDAYEYPRTGLYSAALPIAGLVCLGFWVLAIWKAVDLIGGG